MADKEKLKIAAGALEEELADQLRGVAETKKLINALYRKMGDPLPFTDIEEPGVVSRNIAAVRPDQFANAANPAEAAKLFLKWRGQEAGAAPVAEVYEAIKKGGFKFVGKDAEAGTRVSIGKDRALVRFPATDTVGLADWYPRRKAVTVGKNGKAEETEEAAEAEGEEPSTEPAKEPTPSDQPVLKFKKDNG